MSVVLSSRIRPSIWEGEWGLLGQEWESLSYFRKTDELKDPFERMQGIEPNITERRAMDSATRSIV